MIQWVRRNSGAASHQAEAAVETVAMEQESLRHSVESFLTGVQAA